jgi:hypothetical protein
MVPRPPWIPEQMPSRRGREARSSADACWDTYRLWGGPGFEEFPAGQVKSRS